MLNVIHEDNMTHKISAFGNFVFSNYGSISNFSRRLNISRPTASWYVNVSPSRLSIAHLVMIAQDTGEDIASIVALIENSDNLITVKEYERDTY